MKLHEYQAKELLARHGIPTPRGEVISTAAEARAIAERLGSKVMLKAQVLVGGRGKAGGIVLAEDSDAAEMHATHLLSSSLKGLPVRQLLVEEALEIERELYLGLTLDRSSRCVVAIASAEGGVEIETLARHRPASIRRVALDPFLGLRPYQARELAQSLGLQPSLWSALGDIAARLYACFMAHECLLLEINPLALTRDGRLVAADAKAMLDDNALYRHPELAEWRGTQEDPREEEARRHGMSYVKLSGQIGCMVNGAGLAMATLDVLRLCGGSPANFFDIGGGARAEKAYAALRLLLADPDVRVVLVNIFGGITRCDEIARGLVNALGDAGRKVPMVVRLVGTNEQEGQSILAQAQLEGASSLIEAARKAVEATQRVTGEAAL